MHGKEVSKSLGKILPPICRFGLSGILLLAAVTKSLSIGELEATIAASALFPDEWVSAVAYSLAGAEFTLGIALLWLKLSRWILPAVVALSGLFFGFSVWRWHQDIAVPCNCFGMLLKMTPLQSSVLTLVMCIAALKLLKELPVRLDSSTYVRNSNELLGGSQ